MNHSIKPAQRLPILGIFLLISFGVFSQDVYVKETTLSGTDHEGESYFYTKSVILTNGFHAKGSDGAFQINSIPTSPPPSLDQNFIRVEVPKVEVTSESELIDMGADEKATTYTYIDGLGREVQKVIVEGSPSLKDIIEPKIYDSHGRQPIEYLPYSKGTSGAYRSDAVTDQSGYEQEVFYQTAAKISHDTRPFTEHTFDNSPLNRVLSSYLPGNQWKTDSKDIENEYEVNVANEVRKWTIATGGLPSGDDHYSANELWVEIVKGEDGQVTKEYTNGRDQLILSRVKKDGSSWYDTYYIYDDFGNLRFVIPPRLVALNITPDWTLTRAFAFEYKYDKRQRVIEKYIPGAVNPSDPEIGEPIYIIYDQWDRQVMTQDGVQRSKSPDEWTYTKYDNFNRPIVTGIYTNNSSRASLQSSVDGHNVRNETTSSNDIGYTLNQTYPLSPDIDMVLTVTYYDDYNYQNSDWDQLDFTSVGGFENSENTSVKGQVTGNMVRGIGTSWLRSAIYYDRKYREIQSISDNHLNGTDRVTNKYDYIGNVTDTEIHHTSDTESITILKQYYYDHANRLLQEFNTIDNDRVLVVENEYNELGEVIERNLHSTDDGANFLQSVDQRFNIRGWLTDINHHQLANDGTINDDNNDLFGMRLSYNQDQYTINSNQLDKQYSGNIAGMKWSSNNLADPVEEQGYTYDYDKVNRLEIATYGRNTGNDTNFGGDEYYSMNASYDENGNILSLNRKGKVDNALDLLDNLIYTYENADKSNRLERVVDNGNDDEGFKEDSSIPGRIYYYDHNGNLTGDAYKEITDIEYNHLNLPILVTFFDGRSIKYEYNGSGTKLRKTVTDGETPSTTDYLSVGQYKEGELEFLFTSEGRVVRYIDEANYEYFLKDHLGNTRVTFGNLPEHNEYLATMESENSSYEESQFAFPTHANIRTSTSDVNNIQNHTPLGNESVELNGTVNGREVGPAKVLTIASGDKVEIEVWAKYVDTGWNNSSITDIITVLGTAFGVSSSGTGAESASSAYADALSLGSPGVYSGSDTGEPEAYLQYMFFDANHQYVPDTDVSFFKPVTSASNGSFARLESGTLTFDEPGYLLVYVVNESDQDKNVYFDDLKIVHESAETNLKVSQAQDYYPFGGSFNEYSYGLGKENQYLYNGKEKQKETDWYDYGARMYDYQLGRWNHIDPLAEDLHSVTPYNYAMNNPLVFIDPDGEFPIKITVRSFAPFDWFGARGWMGDNRGFSTSSYVTSRLSQNTSYDTDIPGKFNHQASGSVSLSRYGVVSRSEANPLVFSNQANSFSTHLSGNDDAIIPGLDGTFFENYQSPDIDLHTNLTVNSSEPDEDGFQTLVISGELIGDGFPAAEAFVTDENGNSIFIGVGQAKFGPTEGPFEALWGDTKRQTYKVEVSIIVKDGTFLGVKDGDDIIGINEWNKRFTEQNTQGIYGGHTVPSEIVRYGEN